MKGENLPPHNQRPARRQELSKRLNVTPIEKSNVGSKFCSLFCYLT